jgi:uridine phosphorylase
MANLDLTEQLNRHLISMEDDYLYHLSLSKKDAEMFSGVRYVVIGGSNDRMTAFAAIVAEQLGLGSASVKSVGAHKRYVSFLVGPVFICSHGMGGPSISILLNEIAKLLIYANANAVWIRMGTCGGIGLEEGSIAIT